MIFDDLDELDASKTKIKVVGVGGAGNNAINHMIENEVLGVEFWAVNTDAQALKSSRTQNRLLIGKTTTHGQGAGANPEVGRAAAIESEDDIHEMIGDAQMVFITCGMGGGTGTGAAPVIAKVAREHECLVVGICTKPFAFEGPGRTANAVAGLEALREYVDTLIVIPNQRLLQIVDTSTGILSAFREADNVLRKGVQGVAEIIAIPGLINVDFADVNTVMKKKGTALLGIGVAKGENRAVEAARNAIHSPLLEVTIDGATNAIVNINASTSLSLTEVDQAIEEIRNNSGKDLDIIFGASINTDLKDELVVTVIATGYELKAQKSGFDELRTAIFKNMSDDNINYTSVDEDDYFETELDTSKEKLGEVFDNLSPREERRRQKEEKRRQKELEKEKMKNEKVSESQSDLPSWLRRN